VASGKNVQRRLGAARRARGSERSQRSAQLAQPARNDYLPPQRVARGVGKGVLKCLGRVSRVVAKAWRVLARGQRAQRHGCAAGARGRRCRKEQGLQLAQDAIRVDVAAGCAQLDGLHQLLSEPAAPVGRER
jgi:hypothetical protein